MVLTVDTRAPGEVLPEDYSGLSYEMQRALPDANGNYYFRDANKPLISMFKTLGIKSLRIGGNTADRPALKFPEPQDLDKLFAFARAAGVRVIFTLRLREGDPAKSAAIAKYILQHYREQMRCFAIGNEPNVFTSRYQDFVDAFKKHSDAILAVAPEARFCGPGSDPEAKRIGRAILPGNSQPVGGSRSLRTTITRAVIPPGSPTRRRAGDGCSPRSC